MNYYRPCINKQMLDILISRNSTENSIVFCLIWIVANTCCEEQDSILQLEYKNLWLQKGGAHTKE